jgi:hypothetical protein
MQTKMLYSIETSQSILLFQNQLKLNSNCQITVSKSTQIVKINTFITHQQNQNPNIVYLYQLIQQTESKSTHSSLINKQTQTKSTKAKRSKSQTKSKPKENQIKPVSERENKKRVRCE